MRKRILSALLVAVMLLSLVPVTAVSAADGSEATTPAIESWNDLYVKDGLEVFFDAFIADDTIDLENGKWYAKKYDEESKSWQKDQDQFASLISEAYGDENATVAWTMGSNGGVGYADPDGNTLVKFKLSKNRIMFDAELLNRNIFTVETVLSATMRSAGTEQSKLDANPFAFGTLGSVAYDGLDTSSGGGVIRWHYGTGTWQESNWSKNCAWFADDGKALANQSGKVVTLTATRTTDTATKGRTYTVSLNNNLLVNKTDDGTKMNGVDTNARFMLMSGLPGTVYAVRVYNTVLTESQRLQNCGVDILKYVGYDIAKVADLSLNQLAFFARNVGEKTFDVSAADIDALLEVAKKVVATAYDELYVGADGSATANGGHLITLLSSFGNDTSVDLNRNKWYAKIGGYDATIYNYENSDKETENQGKVEWKRDAKGGIGYDMTVAQYKLTRNAATGKIPGIVLSTSALSKTAFTVESAVRVVGLSDLFDEDGKRIVYAGDDLTYGLYTENSMAFAWGVLSISAWVGDAPKYQMHNRWCYSTQSSWSGGSGEKHISSDSIFKGQPNGMNHVTAMTVRMRTDANGKHAYQACLDARVDLNGNKKGTNSADNYWTHASNNFDPTAGAFTLLNNIGGYAYAVRVYDAVLTEEEQAINHFVDLAAYIGLDVTEYAKLSTGAKQLVGKECAAIRFEEATAEILNAAIANGKALDSALTYVGLSARVNGTATEQNAGIRSVYKLDDTAIAALEEHYKVTYGAMVGIAALDGVTYFTNASKLTVTGSFATGFEAGKTGSQAITIYKTGATEANAQSKFLTNADGNGHPGFAFTTILSGDNATKEYYEMGLVYAGFLVLTDKTTGETVQTIYIPASGETFAQDGAPTSIYEVASHFATLPEYESNPILNKVLDACNENN